MKEIKYVPGYRNFISNSDPDFLTRYGSGSASEKITVPTVPVPQDCSPRACFSGGRSE